MAILPRETEIRKLVQFFRQAVKELSGKFISGMTLDPDRLYALIRSAVLVLDDIDLKAERWAKKNIADFYRIVHDETRKRLRDMGLDPPSARRAKAFAVVARDAIEALLNDPEVGFLYSLHDATDQIKRRMEKIRNQAKLMRDRQASLDKVIAKVQVFEGKGLQDVKQALVKEITSFKGAQDLVYRSATVSKLGDKSLMGNLANLPFVEIPTKDGSRYLRVDRYAELVARTKTSQATNLARQNAIMESGADLVRISNNLSKTDDACNMYIGRAFALTAAAEKEFGVPHIDQTPNGGPPFHPNCTHSLLVFLPELAEGALSDKAMSIPPSWTLGRDFGDVQKDYNSRGGMAVARSDNPNFGSAQNTGGRQRRLERAGRSPTEGLGEE